MAFKISMHAFALIAVANVLVLPLNFHSAHGFVRNYQLPTMPLKVANPVRNRESPPTALWYTDTDTVSEVDIEEIREELESYYGSSTEEFEETIATHPSYTDEEVTIQSAEDSVTVSESSNKETWGNIQQNLATKWEQAASIARETLQKVTTGSSSNLFGEHSSDDVGSSVSSNVSSSSPSTDVTREERYERALAEGMSMSSSALKQGLKDRGMYKTGNFFEKSDLVKAYANAVANKDEREDPKASYGDTKTTQEFDPSYRSVVMRVFDPRTLSRGDLVIDIPKI